jgi:hypothetical protein
LAVFHRKFLRSMIIKRQFSFLKVFLPPQYRTVRTSSTLMPE